MRLEWSKVEVQMKGKCTRNVRRNRKYCKQSIEEFSQLRVLLMNRNTKKRIDAQIMCI
jgi:hypothetical protein